MDGDLHWKYDGEIDYPDSPGTLKKVYTKWAGTYDQDMNDCNDVSNKTMAEACIGLIDNNESTEMLDVGAGTGLTAKYFKRTGFKGQIDGMDMSRAMLDVAAQKGVYRRTFIHFLTEHDPIPVINSGYDVVTAAGCFMVNHIPSRCLDHILDVLKTGGLFICNSRIAKENDDYINELVEYGEILENEGRIKLIKKVQVPYDEGKSTCFVFVYKKI